MGTFYGLKIKEGIINPATDKAWTINDVPKFWNAKVKTWLEENGG